MDLEIGQHEQVLEGSGARRQTMMTKTISWLEDDVPVSSRFDDTYFSKQGGRDEVRHVFLDGNGLPRRWQGRSRFTIAELGFGTGLSFLETAKTWRECAPEAAILDFISFEQFPVAPEVMTKTMAQWPDLRMLCDELCAVLECAPGWNRVAFGETIRLSLAVGDANAIIRDWPGMADAWYLDGFSPSKNPELWNETLMSDVAARTVDGGTVATFTAAGWVRRNLVSAGFDVQKTPGFGRKRDMVKGIRQSGTSGIVGVAGD